MAVYDTQGRPVVVDIESAYTAGVQGLGVSTLGNTAGNTGTSTGTVVLAGSNNITLSQSSNTAGNTIWIQLTGGGAGDGVNIVSASGNTAGTLTSQSTGTVVLAGGANITLSQSSNTISIVGGAGAGGAAISAGTQSQNTGTVIFSNSNGVSFGLNAGTLTASAAGGAADGVNIVSIDPLGNTIGFGPYSQSTGSIGLFGGQNITLSQQSATSLRSRIYIDGAPWGIAAVSAGASSTSNGTVILSNSNNVIFGLGAAGIVTALATFSQSQQAMYWSASGTSTSSSTMQFGNTNGVSFSLSGGSLVGSVAAFAASLSGNSTSGGAGYSNITNGTMILAGGNNITLSQDGSRVTISGANVGGAQTGISGVGASDTTYSSGTVIWSAQANITVGSSVNGASQYVRLSVGNYLTTAAQSNQVVNSLNGSTGQISLATGSSLSSSSNGSTITFGLASNITTALQSAGAYLTSQSNQALSGSNGSFTFQTATFGNSNGLSFYTTNGSMVGSYTVPTVPTAYVSSVNGSSGAISFATGSSLSSSQNGSTVTWGLASNITTALQSAGAYLTTARASNDAVGLNTALTAGPLAWTVNSGGISLNAGSAAGTSTGFAGANISMSMTHNTAGLNISASVAAPGAAAENNWINLSGNTAGNTTASGSTIKWFGGANITLHGTNGSEVSIIGGAGGGLTISRYYPYDVPIYGANTGVSASHSAGTNTSATMYMYPFRVEGYVAAAYMNIHVSENFTTLGTSSGRQTGGFAYAIYVQDTGTNASRLNTTYRSGNITWAVTGNNSSYTVNYPTSYYSNTFSSGATNSAGSNLTSIFTGIKELVFPIGATMTPGHYWLGVLHTLSSSSVNVGLLHSIFGWNMGSSLLNAAPIGSLSSAYTAGSRWSLGFGAAYGWGHGSITAANLATVLASVPISNISRNGFSVMPYMALWST